MKCSNCGTECENELCLMCEYKMKNNRRTKRKNIIVAIVKIILSIFVGSVASFVLILISEGLHALVTCGLFALIVASIIYYAMENSGLKKLVSVAVFIISFILYVFPYSYVNEESDSYLLFGLVAFIPYIFLAYIALTGSQEE